MKETKGLYFTLESIENSEKKTRRQDDLCDFRAKLPRILLAIFRIK